MNDSSGVSHTAQFENVLRQHAGMISRIALSFEHNEQERQDLKQEIWLAVWRALPAYRGEASLKTFVAMVAQRRAISHVRKQTSLPRTSEVDVELIGNAPGQEQAAIENDLQAKLRVALASLSVAQHETALLLLEGFAYGEIATILGISVNAATLRCQRAKASLTEALRDMQ